MKSSAMGSMLFRQAWRRRRGLLPQTPLEVDPDEDEDAAGDLERVERLGEQDEREEDAEERLEVVDDHGPRGADPGDGGEPEDVREEERPDDRVREAEPRESAEVELLARDLRDRDGRERQPAE